MATKPNAKDYTLPPSCINADENAEGGLAKHLEPLCLSLAERVLLYNQEVLFLQGKEILQGLTKLNANGVAAAAVDGGHVPAADLGAVAAANGGLTPAASSEPAAAGTRRVRPWAEAFASAARSARGLASAFEMKAKAEEDEEARKKLRDGVKESTRRAAKAVQLKDKDIFFDGESSATEGREQGTTKAGEKSNATQSLVTGAGEHDAIKSNGLRAVAGRAKYSEQQRKALTHARELLAREFGDKYIVPKNRTASVVGKTMERDGTDTARIKEKNLNKRVRSPVLTSNSAAEERHAFEQTENQHRNKKVKVEVKVKSEPGNGAL